MPVDTLQFEREKDAIVSLMYKCRPLTAASYPSDNFLISHNIKRKGNDLFKSFEGRLAAQMSRYNVQESSIALLSSIVSLLLLAKASDSDSQRVPILYSFGTNTNTPVTAEAANDDMVMLAENEAVAFVIHQCDNALQSSSRLSPLISSYFSPGRAVNNPQSSFTKEKILLSALDAQ